MILSTTTIKGEGSDREALVEMIKPATDSAIMVKVKGMENEHGNCLFALDMHEGQLRLFVWGDRTRAEYTHVINLDTGKVEENNE
ncbi:MAG: hypothetical protein AB7L09_02025 [Nitrospira sp.]